MLNTVFISSHFYRLESQTGFIQNARIQSSSVPQNLWNPDKDTLNITDLKINPRPVVNPLTTVGGKRNESLQSISKLIYLF